MKTTKMEEKNLTTKADFRKEFGVPRETLQGQYLKSEARIDTVEKKDYRKMWQNDGQISAIVQLPQLLIQGTGFDIINDGEDGMDQEMDLVRENLTSPSLLGGMKTPINNVIADMTYFPFEGARFYELVFKLDSGKIKIDKIASRDNITCYPTSDDHGEFTGFYQRTTMHSRTVEVFIPKEKAVALIYRESYGGLNGMPILRPVWYHWDKKHKLYFIAHLASELDTIPPKLLKNKGMTSETLSAVEQAIDEIGLQSRITIPADQAEIEQLSNNGQSKVNIKELIDHHNSLISKALLAQWLDLGSEGSSTGSRSLADEQIQVYYQFLEGIMSQIEYAFNNYIIPKLIDFNFGTKRYPKLKFNPIEDEKVQTIKEAFMEILRSGGTASINKSIVDKVAEDLGLEIEEIEESEEVEEEVVEPTQETKPEEVKEDVELSEHTPRMLAEEEKKVDFVRLQEILNDDTDKLFNNLKATIDNQRIIDEAIAILKTGDISRLTDLQVANKLEISSILDGSMRDVYEKTKLEAYREIDQPAQATKPESRTVIQIGATTNGSKLVEDLKSRLINIIKEAVINGVTDRQLELSLNDELISFVDKNVKTTASQNVINTLNQARLDTFRDNEEVVGYTYSAVMDGNTTQFCRSMDGKRFAYNDPYLARITPPNHFNCRSTLVPILKSDKVIIGGELKPISFDSLYQFKDIPALSDDIESLTIDSKQLLQLKEIVKDAKEYITKTVEEINGQDHTSNN